MITTRQEKKTLAICRELLGAKRTVSIEQLEKIRSSQQERIDKFLPVLGKLSVPICGAIIKCAVKFGDEKAMAFAEAVKNARFSGATDPVHLFWLYKQTNASKKTSQHVYRCTINACKAFCEGRTLYRLSPRKSDIFDEWNEDFTGPK